jgi:hypothetical protein
VRSNVPRSYKQAARAVAGKVAGIFERYFVIPDVADWLAVVGIYVQLGDIVFSDAVRREGRISAPRLLEAQKLRNAYLAFYLPPSLHARPTAEGDQKNSLNHLENHDFTENSLRSIAGAAQFHYAFMV